MDGEIFQPTKQGTIQGGPLSPLLANIALHELEQYIKEALADDLLQYKRKTHSKASRKDAQSSISVITYADDFVIIHESEEMILKTKTLVKDWLKTVGLELSEDKTRVVHTLKPTNGEKPGFDFLGFTIRQYPVRLKKKDYKTLIKPSRKSIKRHNLMIKSRLRKMRGATQEIVIKALNPIIKGWSQYFKTVVSSKIFSSLDDIMFKRLRRWAIYRHPNKGKGWVKEKYFKKYKNDNWRFTTSSGTHLAKHRDITIKRHVKVKQKKSPFDGDWTYWANRARKIPDKSPRVVTLLEQQQGKCDHCRLYIRSKDVTEVHHRDRNRKNNDIKNLALLHGHCHDMLHGKCAWQAPSWRGAG